LESGEISSSVSPHQSVYTYVRPHSLLPFPLLPLLRGTQEEEEGQRGERRCPLPPLLLGVCGEKGEATNTLGRAGEPQGGWPAAEEGEGQGRRDGEEALTDDDDDDGDPFRGGLGVKMECPVCSKAEKRRFRDAMLYVVHTLLAEEEGRNCRRGRLAGSHAYLASKGFSPRSSHNVM